MYGIYGNIYHQYTPNVSIYTIHGSYGYGFLSRESCDESCDQESEFSEDPMEEQMREQVDVPVDRVAMPESHRKSMAEHLRGYWSVDESKPMIFGICSV